MEAQNTGNQAQYVVVKKARGPLGVYREIVYGPMEFDAAKEANTGCNIQELTDAVIEFYVAPFNGKGIGQDY